MLPTKDKEYIYIIYGEKERESILTGKKWYSGKTKLIYTTKNNMCLLISPIDPSN